MAERCVTIDCDYLGPAFAAAYLRTSASEAAFVETNTRFAVPKLLAALSDEGLRPEQVRWVVVTHAHLDHSAGAGALMRACPNAVLLVHPRAARHLVDPSRLVESARKVYGAARFDELYGEIEPIPESRVRAMDDGAEVFLGDAPLRFLHVRGHANHHVAVHDPAMDSAFTGDAFGLCYPRLGRGLLAFPSTSPTDFDAAEALASVDRIAGLGTKTVRLTHFGEHASPGALAEQLRGWLRLAGALVDEAAAGELSAKEIEGRVAARLRQELAAEATRAGLAIGDDDWAIASLDLELNAQGIAWTATRRRAR